MGYTTNKYGPIGSIHRHQFCNLMGVCFGSKIRESHLKRKYEQKISELTGIEQSFVDFTDMSVREYITDGMNTELAFSLNEEYKSYIKINASFTAENATYLEAFAKNLLHTKYRGIDIEKMAQLQRKEDYSTMIGSIRR